MLISYSELAEQIVALDDRVRFAGVANRLGKVVACNYRKGLVPLLSGEETEQSIPQSVVKNSLQPILESKLGRTAYSITIYEKIKRAMIPLYDQNGSVGSILLVSFNVETPSNDVEHIILERILPLVRGNDDRQQACRRFYKG
jgi:hypothetical protein